MCARAIFIEVVPDGTQVPEGSGSNVEVYSGLADALANSPSGSVIYMSPGTYTGTAAFGPDYVVTFIGSPDVVLQDITYLSADAGSNNIIFENVTFKNTTNHGFVFDGGNFTFRNCQFIASIDGDLLLRSESGTQSGIDFQNGTIQLYNSAFRFTVSNLDSFLAINTYNIKSLDSQSSSIFVLYSKVPSIVSFSAKGEDATTDLFRAAGTYIELKTTLGRRSKIQFFQGSGHVNAILNGSQINLIGGRGRIDLGSGDQPVYVNGLTLTSENPSQWKATQRGPLFITAFLSNLACSCK